MTHKDNFKKEEPKTFREQINDFVGKFFTLTIIIPMLIFGYWFSKYMGYEVFIMSGIFTSIMLLPIVLGSFFNSKFITKGFSLVNLIIIIVVGYCFYLLTMDYKENVEYNIAEFDTGHLKIEKNYTLLCTSCEDTITKNTENLFCGECGNKFDTVYDGKILIFNKDMNKISISDSIVDFDDTYPLKFYSKYRVHPYMENCKTSLVTETLLKSDLMRDYIGISLFYEGYNYNGIVKFE